MCDAAVHNVERTLTENQRDPSRTTSIRTAFVNNMNRRFKALTTVIKKAVVTDDVFGLIGNSDINITTLAEMRSPGRRRFAFTRDSRKVEAFINWLRQQAEAGILDISRFSQVGESVESAWTNLYINDSYRRGVIRARYQMVRDLGLDIPSIEESGGANVAMTAPLHVERLGLLFTRAFNELRGITDSMSQQIGRILAQGLADGIGPAKLARMLVHAISGEGSTLGLPISYVDPRTGQLVNYFMPAKRRAQILARTEVIRAHAEAQLMEFKNWGIEGVRVKAEWVTAGDQRVCPDCAAMEGSRFTIEEASGMIPLHPQCRCIWIPYEISGRRSR